MSDFWAGTYTSSACTRYSGKFRNKFGSAGQEKSHTDDDLDILFAEGIVAGQVGVVQEGPREGSEKLGSNHLQARKPCTKEQNRTEGKVSTSIQNTAGGAVVT